MWTLFSLRCAEGDTVGDLRHNHMCFDSYCESGMHNLSYNTISNGTKVEASFSCV